MVLQPPQDFGHSRIEVHLKPGVMDPVAASTEMAIRDMGLPVREVRTGRAFVIVGSVPREQLERIASRVLANGVIESLHFDAFIPEKFPAGQQYKLDVRRVPLLNLSDEQLQQLSREGHLFLSLTEMKAVQGKPADIGGYYKADTAKVQAVMRPSATFNAALAGALG